MDLKKLVQEAEKQHNFEKELEIKRKVQGILVDIEKWSAEIQTQTRLIEKLKGKIAKAKVKLDMLREGDENVLKQLGKQKDEQN